MLLLLNGFKLIFTGNTEKISRHFCKIKWIKTSQHNRNTRLLHEEQVYTVYPILTTGLVWPCFKNQSTIICAAFPPIKCSIQPLFKLKENIFSHRVKLLGHVLVDQRWVWFERAITSKWRFVAKSESQVGTSPLPLSSETQEVRRMDGKSSAKARLTLGSGVSAALMENGYCSSYFYIIPLWFVQCLIQLFSFGVNVTTIVHKQQQWCENKITHYIKIMLLIHWTMK